MKSAKLRIKVSVTLIPEDASEWTVDEINETEHTYEDMFEKACREIFEVVERMDEATLEELLKKETDDE